MRTSMRKYRALYFVVISNIQGVDVAELNDRRLHVLDETLYISGITAQQEVRHFMCQCFMYR